MQLPYLVPNWILSDCWRHVPTSRGLSGLQEHQAAARKAERDPLCLFWDRHSAPARLDVQITAGHIQHLMQHSSCRWRCCTRRA